jgi:predicted transcriptional regulator
MRHNDTVSKFLGNRHTAILESCHSVSHALDLMENNGLDAIGVQTFGRFSGLFTRSDFVKRVLRQNLNPNRTILFDVMTVSPFTIPHDTKISLAYRIMKDQKISHLPVLDIYEDVFLGMITEEDLRNDVCTFMDQFAGRDKAMLGYFNEESYALCANG